MLLICKKWENSKSIVRQQAVMVVRADDKFTVKIVKAKVMEVNSPAARRLN